MNADTQTTYTDEQLEKQKEKDMGIREQLIGRIITKKELKKFKKIEKDCNFHIYGQRNKSGGGHHHDIGTPRPTSNPADCDSYWTRRRTDGSYIAEPNIGGNHGIMTWVLMDDDKILIGCIISDEHLVIDYSQRIINNRGNIKGMAFYNRR